MTSQPQNTLKAIDSLTAHEFAVEINGQPVEGVFGVRNLASFTLEGDIPPLTIVKMVQRNPNTPFNLWTRESLKGHHPLRDVAVVAMDEGVETRRWVYKNAYVIQITFSDFDTAASELVEERVTMKAEEVQEIWPGAALG